MPKPRRHSRTSGPVPGKAGPISASKRRTFTLILGAIPLVFIIGLELFLRTVSYDGDLDLVIRKDIGDVKLFTLNRSVARRYFTQAGIEFPQPQDDAFAVTKPAGAVRIFCLGESTMQGFPYEYNATAPSFLRDRLQAQLPESHIEVINAGLSAVGSYVVKDFLSELVNFQPDLFIIYVGHNEFYGAYGPGSAVAVKGGPWLTRLSLSLLRFKTYLLLRDAYAWLAGKLAPSPPAHDATMMEQMVGKAEIPYGSPAYRSGLAIYVENIEAMIAVAQEHHVPILFSTVVSNVGDRPPFVSLFSPHTTPDQKKEWTGLTARGDSLTARGDFNGAAEAYRRGTSLDSSNASGFFRLGKALAAAGLYDEARPALMRARDLDALRFRASGEFDDSLLAVCRRHGVPVSDIDSAFAAASPHGLVGNKLILEHLHPNIGGYFLMAKTWAHDIRALGILGPAIGWKESPDDEELMWRSTVSSFDEEVGRFRTDVLTHHWPFPPGASSTPLAAQDSEQAILSAYLHHRMSWSEARYELADYHARRGEFEAARKEILAVAHVLPFAFLPLLRVADYYVMEGKRTEAEEFYRQSIAVEDNQYGHMKLGLCYFDDGRPEEAAREIETAFTLEGRHGGKFPLHGAATGRFYLGVAYARTGRTADARLQLERALAIEPDLKMARDFLEKMK